jgi:hypothetical protein
MNENINNDPCQIDKDFINKITGAIMPDIIYNRSIRRLQIFLWDIVLITKFLIIFKRKKDATIVSIIEIILNISLYIISLIRLLI